MNLLQVKKLHKDAIIPSYAHPGEDAAFDLCCIEDIKLTPFVPLKVRTGIATEFSPGLYAQILGRSSLSAIGIAVLGGVIDSGYRGEWFVNLICLNKDIKPEFKAGHKIAQCVIKVVPQVIIKESETLSDSRRGANGFGSTDPNRPYKALHTA